MENKEIAEVEVQEEVLDTVSEQQDEQLYSQAEFDALLATTYATFLQQDEEYDGHIEDALQRLFSKAKEDMDANSHMKLLYMAAKKFDSEGNKNAAAYCAMRMKAIQGLYHGKKKKPKFLTLNTLDITSKQTAFIEEETAFIVNFLKDMYKKLFQMSIFMFFLLFAVLVFVLQVNPIYAGIEALFTASLAYGINKLRLPKMFERKQLDVLAKHVDTFVLELDAPIRFS